MTELKGTVLQIVASPKQFLWAPFEMAIVNLVLGLVIMLLCIAVFDITPFFSLIPIVGGHTALVGLGARNPHLTTTLQATGIYPPSRRNLSKVSAGVKYVP